MNRHLLDFVERAGRRSEWKCETSPAVIVTHLRQGYRLVRYEDEEVHIIGPDGELICKLKAHTRIAKCELPS